MNDFSHNDLPISAPSEDRFGIDPFAAALAKRAVSVTRPSGGTKAAVILDELNPHAEKLDQAHIQPLLLALFEVADEINVEEDSKKRLFSLCSNDLTTQMTSPLERSLNRRYFKC